MPIVNLFSKRQKVLRKEVPDVYEYDQIPDPLRVQITHILYDLVGHPTQFDSASEQSRTHYAGNMVSLSSLNRGT
jgi:hypothetical protein